MCCAFPLATTPSSPTLPLRRWRYLHPNPKILSHTLTKLMYRIPKSLGSSFRSLLFLYVLSFQVVHTFSCRTFEEFIQGGIYVKLSLLLLLFQSLLLLLLLIKLHAGRSRNWIFKTMRNSTNDFKFGGQSITISLPDEPRKIVLKNYWKNGSQKRLTAFGM